MSEQFITALGPVTPSWERKTIADLAVYVGSGVTPTGGSDVYTTSGVTFIRSQNVTNDGLLLDDVAFIDEKTHERMTGSEVVPFDVLLNITGASIGRCCFLPSGLGPTNVNQHVCTIRLPVADEGDAKYLSSVLSSPIGQNQIFRLNAGGNREGLNYQQLRRFQIPWPPKFLRGKIARILTTLDNVITQTEALIAKYQAIKQGLMHDLFTRGVDATGKLRPPQSEAPELYKQSELGWIPKDWEVDSIENRCEVRSGGTPNRLQADRYFKEGTIPWVKTLDLNEDTITKTDELITEYALRESSCSVLPENTVLIAMYGGFLQIGRTGILAFPATTNQAISSLQQITSASPRFLLRYLQFARFRWRQFAMSTRKDPNITKSDILRFLLALPQKQEQHAITERVESVNNSIKSERSYLAILKQTKTGLMQDLLTGKVPVNADEPEEITP